jgi:hypothetical protein
MGQIDALLNFAQRIDARQVIAQLPAATSLDAEIHTTPGDTLEKVKASAQYLIERIDREMVEMRCLRCDRRLTPRLVVPRPTAPAYCGPCEAELGA